MTAPVLITIGSKYAQILGYEEVVGAMGIISDAMSALMEVEVMCGPAIGQKFDVHKEDITVLAVEKDVERYFIADYDNMAVFFTANPKQFDFILEHFSYDRTFRAFGKGMLQDSIQFFNRFTFHDVDSPSDNVTRLFRDTFQSMEVEH